MVRRQLVIVTRLPCLKTETVDVQGYTCDVKPTTSGTLVSHEAEGRSPFMTRADASRESAGRGNHLRQILSVVLALNLAVSAADGMKRWSQWPSAL